MVCFCLPWIVPLLVFISNVKRPVVDEGSRFLFEIEEDINSSPRKVGDKGMFDMEKTGSRRTKVFVGYSNKTIGSTR